MQPIGWHVLKVLIAYLAGVTLESFEPTRLSVKILPAQLPHVLPRRQVYSDLPSSYRVSSGRQRLPREKYVCSVNGLSEAYYIIVIDTTVVMYVDP